MLRSKERASPDEVKENCRVRGVDVLNFRANHSLRAERSGPIGVFIPRYLVVIRRSGQYVGVTITIYVSRSH